MVKATNINEEAVKSKAAGTARRSGLGFMLSCFSSALTAPGDIGAAVGLAATFLEYYHFLTP